MESCPSNPARVIVVCAACHQTQGSAAGPRTPLADVTYTLCAPCVADRISGAAGRLPVVPTHSRLEFAPGSR